MLDAINKHIDNVDVCRTGCCALTYLNQNNSKKKWYIAHTLIITFVNDQDDIQLLTRNAGGIETMLKVVNKHVDNEAVSKFGCSGIFYMINNNSKIEKNCNLFIFLSCD